MLPPTLEAELNYNQLNQIVLGAPSPLSGHLLCVYLMSGSRSPWRGGEGALTWGTSGCVCEERPLPRLEALPSTDALLSHTQTGVCLLPQPFRLRGVLYHVNLENVREEKNQNLRS